MLAKRFPAYCQEIVCLTNILFHHPKGVICLITAVVILGIAVSIKDSLFWAHVIDIFKDLIRFTFPVGFLLRSDELTLYAQRKIIEKYKHHVHYKITKNVS